MASLSTWIRYIAHKFEYSVSLSWQRYTGGHIAEAEVGDVVWKNLLQGKLTYLHWNKGQEMAPTIAEEGGTLLVRKLPVPSPTQVFVGDVVVVKDPVKSDSHLVRRLAAVEGYEMVSTDEKDTPFVLEKDECWVLADNKNLKPKVEFYAKQDSLFSMLGEHEKENDFRLWNFHSTKLNKVTYLHNLPSNNDHKEAKDSRIFGPVPMSDIVGRVIYCLKNAVDHGPVQNSHFGMRKDSPVLQVELDVDEMAKNHKA